MYMQRVLKNGQSTSPRPCFLFSPSVTAHVPALRHLRFPVAFRIMQHVCLGYFLLSEVYVRRGIYQTVAICGAELCMDLHPKPDYSANTTIRSTRLAYLLQAPFKSPWNGDRSDGLQHLEHVNVCIPRHDPAKSFYYGILGFVPDTRRAHNIGKGSGTIWANMGTTQIHLPEGM